MPMREAANSETPLRTTFNIRLNGKVVAIGTVGQAYQFLTSLNSVEWTEFRTLHDNAMLTVQATNALRALFVNAKML